ncbi:MAG TPA: RNA methyltransferase [Holophagaceae bacterium]|jgi:TrmH family RNA methyltransferase|nr:RNA methyltransferase [Holophagaceae bacterium]
MPLKPVASRDNPALKQIRSVLSESGTKRAATLLAGAKLIEAWAEARGQRGADRLRPRQWIRVEGAGPHPLEAELDLPGLLLPEARMRDLTEMKSPPAHALLLDLGPDPAGPLGPRVAGAWGIQDPGNLGAILRSVAAFGFEEVLLGPGCADPFDPRTLRGSMGAAFLVSLRRCRDLAEVLDDGRWIALDGGTGAVPLARADMSEPLRLLVGNEGHGWQGIDLPPSVARAAIPTAGVESLNAAVAMGIACFEASRRRP